MLATLLVVANGATEFKVGSGSTFATVSYVRRNAQETDFVFTWDVPSSWSNDYFWTGLGFNQKEGMNGASVVICKHSSTGDRIDHEYTEYYGVNMLDQQSPQNGLSNMAIRVEGNKMVCSFTRQNSVEGPSSGRYFPFVSNGKFHVIAARGKGDQVMYHGRERFHTKKPLRFSPMVGARIMATSKVEEEKEKDVKTTTTAETTTSETTSTTSTRKTITQTTTIINEEEEEVAVVSTTTESEDEEVSESTTTTTTTEEITTSTETTTTEEMKTSTESTTTEEIKTSTETTTTEEMTTSTETATEKAVIPTTTTTTESNILAAIVSTSTKKMIPVVAVTFPSSIDVPTVPTVTAGRNIIVSSRVESSSSSASFAKKNFSLRWIKSSSSIDIDENDQIDFLLTVQFDFDIVESGKQVWAAIGLNKPGVKGDVDIYLCKWFGVNNNNSTNTKTSNKRSRSKSNIEKKSSDFAHHFHKSSVPSMFFKLERHAITSSRVQTVKNQLICEFSRWNKYERAEELKEFDTPIYFDLTEPNKYIVKMGSGFIDPKDGTIDMNKPIGQVSSSFPVKFY